MKLFRFFNSNKKDTPINEIDLGMMEDIPTRKYLDLDEHRIVLWLILTKVLNPNLVWRSVADYNGNIKSGWFMLGYHINPGKQIFYYLPIEYWKDTHHANIRGRAPKHDGHTSKDITIRLRRLIEK